LYFQYGHFQLKLLLEPNDLKPSFRVIAHIEHMSRLSPDHKKLIVSYILCSIS